MIQSINQKTPINQIFSSENQENTNGQASSHTHSRTPSNASSFEIPIPSINSVTEILSPDAYYLGTFHKNSLDIISNILEETYSEITLPSNNQTSNSNTPLNQLPHA